MSRRLHRNALCAAIALVAAAWLAGCAAPKPAPAQACARDELAFAGLDADRVEGLRFDSCAGTLTRLGALAAVAKPRWLVVDPDRPVLHVASDDGARGGRVVSFAIDKDAGRLTRLGEIDAGGSGTTHLWLDRASSTLLAAHFSGGTTSSIALDADGRPARLVSTVASTGSGPHRRQAGARSHGVLLDPSGRHALVADLGADRLFVMDFDRATRRLSRPAGAAARDWAAPPGSGPHHAVFGHDGRFVYLLDELTADVTVLRWDPAQAGAALTSVQTVPLSTPGFTGAKSGAEIAVGRDGRFVYVANRGENALQTYRVDAASGRLSLVQTVPSGGAAPWSFALHPSGRWMLVANQRGDNVTLFGIDGESGLLSAHGPAIDMPAPLSAVFGG